MTASPLAVAAPPGRDTEASRIAEAIEALEAGSGGVLLLAGEGGVGKTTLSSWAAEEARSRGVFVLDAPCFSLSWETPYVCLVAAFGPVLRGDHDVDPGEVAHGLASLGLLFDGLATPQLDTPDPAAEPLARSRLHGALATVVSRLCARAPVMLQVDDLHWADTASIEVLHALTNDLPHVPLLLLATLRPFESTERTETRQLLRSLRPTEWTTTIEVGGLDLDATRSLVQRRLGSVVPNRLVELVHRRSGGTPLVAEELVELMVETGALRPIGRRWELRIGQDVPVPAIADDLIGDRLERLGTEAVHLVAAVAIGAESITTGLLSEVTGTGVEQLRVELEDLRRAGVVDRAEVAGETAWVVHHPIIGEVAVEMTDASVRSALNRSYADRVPPGAVERRGRHLLGVGAATLGAEDLAVLLEAGRSALDRGAPGEACRLLGAVLETIDDRGVAPDLLPEVLACLGTAWTRRGEYAVAAHHLERARGLARAGGDLVREATLLVDIQDATWSGSYDHAGFDADFDDLVAQLELAGKWAGAHLLRRSQVTARLRAGLGATLDGLLIELDRIEGHVDEPAVRQWGDHVRLLPKLQHLEDAPGVLAALDESLPDVASLPALHRRVLHERLDTLMVLGTREEILGGIRDERLFDERWGDWPTWRIGMASWDVAMGDGDLRRAREIEEMLGLNPNARSAGYVRVATALADLITGTRTVPPVGPSMEVADAADPVLDHLIALAELFEGRTDRRTTAEAVLAAFEQRRYIAGMPLVAVIGAGVAHLVLGDRDSVDGIVRVLRRFDAGAGRASAWASVLEGEVTDDGPARADRYLDAAGRFAALGRPLDVAVCRLTAAEAGADVDPSQVEEAAVVFDAVPAPWMQDRLAALQGGAGRTGPRSASPVDDLGLTSREREVAQVVAEGLSNREVANRLFISVRTVTSHLDHIYTKLGINSRGELAELFSAEGAT